MKSYNSSEHTPHSSLILAALKLIYLVLCVIAGGFLTMVLFSPNAKAADSIYYLDASFSGCDAMDTSFCVSRTETFLHALAALGGDIVQTDSISGAMMADLVAKFDERVAWWTLANGQTYPPRHVIIGYANDVWTPMKRQNIVNGVQYLSDRLFHVCPETTLWVMDYPPITGLNRPELMPDHAQYEAGRAWYRDWASRLPNARVIEGVHDGWQPTQVDHPLIGEDYHVDRRSSLRAAMRIYTAILDF